MPVRLSIDDFKIFNAICEIRFENAYLIFDRTGLVFKEAGISLTNFKVVEATPQHTVFQADEGVMALELALCRFSTVRPDASLEKFAAHCKAFVNSVAFNLDVRVFTRVGFRVLFRKDFEDLAEAKAALTSINLTRLQVEERFGAAEEPIEMILRWEGAQLGAMLRLKAESGNIDVVLPPELGVEQSEIHKSLNSLIVDVDYYTVAPVERSQFDASTWLLRSIRTIKKNVDTILGN